MRYATRYRSKTGRWIVFAFCTAPLLVLGAGWVSARDSVVSTVHNLSSTGPGEVRSLDEKQVCKFCHIPHNEVSVQPLWARPLSQATYEVPDLRSSGVASPAPQPDGSSRLCLSCHDGTIALGESRRGGRGASMVGFSRLSPGRRGFIGTDLSGHHPISFVLPEGDRVENGLSDSDMTLNSLQAIRADREVKIDAEGKMQCNSCHDPHSDNNYVPDRVPRFWVKKTVDEVCLTCHIPR